MASTESGIRGFMSPFEVPAPDGCEGWETMYPYYALFSEGRRESEETRGWFRDGMHFPEPMFPFDFVTADSPYMCLGQANSRIFAVPPALGIDHRVLYGWVYMSANPVTDPEEIGRRAELFGRRAGHYFQNWDELYGRWRAKVEDTIAELEALTVPDLPEIEDEAVVTEGRGIGSAHTLLIAYNRLLESVDRIWQYHFEFLNLGYAAYLVFSELCKQSFPDIPDQTIAQMVSGIDVVLFRPDNELKRLAGRALQAGIAEAVLDTSSEQALRDVLISSDPGRGWLADWDAVKTPWFHYSNGNGFYHHHRSWSDDPDVPLAHLRNYVQRYRQARTSPGRWPRSAPNATASPASTGHCSQTKRRVLRSIRTWGSRAPSSPTSRVTTSTSSTGTTRSSGTRCASSAGCWQRNRFLDDAEDVFYLQRHELADALVDLRLAWAAGSEGRGPSHWPPIVAQRKRIMDAMRKFTPPPALGVVPETITEPMTIMLWGITTERVREWAAEDRDTGATLTGFAGSPGIAEGTARVVLEVQRLGDLQQGEILVAPVTSPSWTPVFGKIAAAVSDIGGIMSHAAIVSREYGLPAVVGTGNATGRIKTGDRVRVDGNAGTVTIVS